MDLPKTVRDHAPGPPVADASILLVDDNRSNLLAVRATLEQLGYEIVEALSGEEALTQLQVREFAVVLLDVLMPGIGGFETARRIRASDRLRHMPIIFLTAHEIDRGQLEAGYALGAVDFLTKPLQPIVLQAKVRGFIELYQARRRAVLEAAQLRLLVQGTVDYAIFLLDAEGRVASWNAGAQRIKQYAAHEIIGQHFSRFYTADAVKRGWPAYELKVAQAEGRFEDEGWRVRKDGSQFWANVIITALRDEAGQLRGFAKITRDMTDRKRAEESARRLVEETTARRVAEENAALIQAQRERLRVTLTSIGDAVISTDASGRIDFLNPAAQALIGWQDEEAVNQPLTEVFHIVNEMTRQPVENPAIKALADGRTVGLANHTLLVSKDGTERPIDDSAAPIRDAAGNIIGSILVFRDISQLKRANQALQDADRRKDEFLAILAHELRNPLAPIRHALEVMKLEQADAQALQQGRDVMERQVQQMIRLVDDLLDVSRAMRGKIELRKEPTELAEVVARAVETAQALIRSQQHRLDISVPSHSLLVDVDPVRLAQVIGNLLTNAAKYTQPHGHIWVTAHREGNQAVLQVRDNGIGIAPDLRPHVFDLFVQADASSARAQGGLGIGLTIVKNLVEKHGGSVVAKSDGLGRGCEFEVRLPLLLARQPERGAAVLAASRERPPAAGHRLLVVDDNADAATTLAMLLRLDGHEVQVAHDGATALEMARSYGPELVLLDLGMPGMDGYEVARRLRQQPGLENVVLAALTGWSQQEDRLRTKEAGFDHHLVKPLAPAALQDLIAQLQR